MANYVAGGKGTPEVCTSPIKLLELLLPRHMLPSPNLDDMSSACWSQSQAQQASFYGYSNGAAGQPRKLGWVTLRTRYLDDALLAALNQLKGQQSQVVVLGAGMDARAWRLPLTESVQ